ncbi:MAG: ThiF family adenylyltransferase, partial [Clostridiales bacterium]|nr:ThiF family adenylyltransferase [Clostridiales bacterium]
ELDYFYLPIFQPDRRGFYSMYFYVVRQDGSSLKVKLEYVVKATQYGYEYLRFKPYEKMFSLAELRAYRKSIESVSEEKSFTPTSEYFKKVSELFPEHVLDKVIVCIGTGGARSFLENMARCGFRNFILIENDIVSPSNIATQDVFVSEMGKKKTTVLRERILDINPDATVICVERFLDADMSDAEFKRYLDRFPHKKPTDYLILGCTDSFDAQDRSALLALKYGIPYLAAMMYEGGAAAEIIFVYPGVTESCPRCLLRERYEKYETGFVNDVGSEGCAIFATERMNATKGYIALMLLMYGEDCDSPWATMLDGVKNRNFVQIRLTPDLKDSKLGIDLFDRAFTDASRYVYFDETIWIPQYPDRPEFGVENCQLCGGTGDLTLLSYKWRYTDTRSLCVRTKRMALLRSQLIAGLFVSDGSISLSNSDEE